MEAFDLIVHSMLSAILTVEKQPRLSLQEENYRSRTRLALIKEREEERTLENFI